MVNRVPIATTTSSSLPPPWDTWLQEAFVNGLLPHKIVEMLYNEGFTPAQLQAAMGSRYPDNISLRETPAFYKKAAEPGFLTRLDNCRVKQYADVPLFTVDDVFTEQECRLITRITLSQLAPSEIVAEQTGKLTRYRTSKTCFMHRTKHPFVDVVEDKLWELMSPQVGGCETVQAQHYEKGGEFKPHCDFFAPGSESYQKLGRSGGQRTWTCMVYIVAPQSGGETVFTEWEVSITPKAGMAVIWNNLYPDGRVNFNTKHHAMPVLAGEKLILTKWFRIRKHNQNQRVRNQGKRTSKPVAQYLNR
ncbi:prolyl hydroxylase family protein [Alteromonas sp. H39]|uniref:prolyl hydroxylase family protein n=1 Tax=Alteromonas sp. H39 TaxID=3389876 RepID=UPI0039E1C1F1